MAGAERRRSSIKIQNPQPSIPRRCLVFPVLNFLKNRQGLYENFFGVSVRAEDICLREFA
jgi:hypothetical protein